MKELQLDQRTIKLQLWDFSGDVQNRFANVAKHAYTEAHGIVIVFDITNKESFDDLGRFEFAFVFLHCWDCFHCCLLMQCMTGIIIWVRMAEIRESLARRIESTNTQTKPC